jgi:tetratricopeptide (TPR) repeat protein
MRKHALGASMLFCAIALGEDGDGLFATYKKELEAKPRDSLTHFRIAEIHFQRGEFQPAANAFREALNGNLQPKWVEVWSLLNLGKVFDLTGQRERAVNEYRQAVRTRDNTRGAVDEAEIYRKTPYPRR